MCPLAIELLANPAVQHEAGQCEDGCSRGCRGGHGRARHCHDGGRADAGYEGQVVVEKVRNMEAGCGLDSASGKWGNMIEMGVLDPVKVSRVTLQNAASIAGLILITEATVTDIPKDTTIEDAISAAAAQGGQGGMY